MQEEVPDLYEVLGVNRGMNQSHIEEQFRSKSQMLQSAGQSTEALEAAYAILTDPESREEYDALLGENADAPPSSESSRCIEHPGLSREADMRLHWERFEGSGGRAWEPAHSTPVTENAASSDNSDSGSVRMA